MTQIETLAAQLLTYREAYYNGQALVPDQVFDEIEEQLRVLAPSHPVLLQVGMAPNSGWAKTKHGCPMGSLSKAQDVGDITNWLIATPSQSYVVMGKLDGASIALRYEHGVFVQAITRGDGDIGEDVTQNVIRMKFPKQLFAPYTGFIRGEVVLPLGAFKTHFAPFGSKNARNAANGTMKRHDGSGCEHLTVFVYEFDNAIGCKTKTLALAEAFGFATPAYHLASSLAEIQAVYESYCQGGREALDYEIDGLVVEVAVREDRDNFGVTDGRPKGAVAYKFPHEQTTTTLGNVIWQTGKSGRVTPVAVFDSVRLAGADVERASLHNVGYIKRLGDLHAGDTVLVSRRNDVIPSVESVVRRGTGLVFTRPDDCPSCQSPLGFEGEYLVCRSDDCPAQVAGAIRRWVNKIGVLNFGEGLINTLVDDGIVTTIYDLYTITPDKIKNIRASNGHIIGTAIADKALANLQSRMDLDLHVFVGSLGIPLFGRSMVKSLVDAGFNTLQKLLESEFRDLAQVEKMGLVKAQAFYLGIRSREALINRLVNEAGIKIKTLNTNGPMVGKSMCMTGFRDAKMHADFEAAGGSVKSSVGKGLTYLVLKDPLSASTKTVKAQQLGVTLLSPADMTALLR